MGPDSSPPDGMANPRGLGPRRLELWLRQADAPVYLVDPHGTLLHVNPAWERLLGRTAADAAALVCHAAGGPTAEVPDPLAIALAPPPEAIDGRIVTARTPLPLADGRTSWRRLLFWPFRDSKGQRLGTLGLILPDEEPRGLREAESQRLRAELLDHRERLRHRYGFDQILGQGPAHGRLLDQIRAAAASDVPTLIVGEAGTGKRLVARTIHQQSPRGTAPLVPFDCAALPPELLDRELFAPAEPGTPGRWALPDDCALLLSDILQLARDLQGRLAEAIAGPVRPRLLGTTAQDPDRLLAAGRLREDFYFAMTGLVIRLRPLRDRADELPLLAEHFLEQANLRHALPSRGFTPAALRALATYDWPGNLRELARIVDAALTRAGGGAIDVPHIPPSILGERGGAFPAGPIEAVAPSLDAALEMVERRMIERALRRARRNKSRAAELLGISRPRLYRRIQELKMPDESDGAAEAEPARDGEPA